MIVILLLKDHAKGTGSRLHPLRPTSFFG